MMFPFPGQSALPLPWVCVPWSNDDIFCFQVKLAYQESELLQLLKKIPLGRMMMDELQARAEQLRDGTLKSRGDALLPLTLATFIFEALCLPCKSGVKVGF